MSTAPHTQPIYLRPPIIEAIIGINFADAVKESILATADRRFAKHYPVHKENSHVNVVITANAGANALVPSGMQEQRITGHKRMSDSMDEIVVLMPNAILLSHLAPYKGWDHILERMKRDWAMYKRPGTYRPIARVGLRYINRVDIVVTGNLVEHELYLNLYPRVPDELGPIVAYMMQTTFHLEKINAQATITTTPVESPTLGHASFIVDIDVYKTADLPMNDKGLMELLQNMRSEKNRIFEACITQRARQEIFDHANP